MAASQEIVPPPEAFTNIIAEITKFLAEIEPGQQLQEDLNRVFPANGSVVQTLTALCRRGCEEGWLCNRSAGGIKFGRVVKPGAGSNNFSVDVVDMNDVVGPHHVHPNGEIDLVMPFDDGAQFDGVGRGWKVYEKGSAHCPTVSGGRALVLYLLPQGAIEFTRAS